MSSDIFSRVLDFSKFDIIYAGAQKTWTCRNYSSVVKKKFLANQVELFQAYWIMKTY
jgi:phosphoserine aminotransferase